MIEAFRVGVLGRGGTLWDGIDLSFADGEVWLVAGPPSCGKSLLLRILRGERRPDAGDVVVGGVSLVRGGRAAAVSFRASAGVVPESFSSEDSAHPRAGRPRTVGDLFRLSAIAAAVPAKERRLREEELLALVGLSHEAGDPAAATPPPGGAHSWELSSLSLSERARLALAVELLRNPRYLFADMLVANAGNHWTDTLRALFRALAREGRTIILAERAVPDRWQVERTCESASGPFSFYRLGVPAIEPKRSDLEWLPPDGPDGKEGA